MGMIAKWVLTKASNDTLTVQLEKVKKYIEQVQLTQPNDQAVAVHYDVTSGRLHLMFSDKAVKDYGLDNGLKTLADYNTLDSEIKGIKELIASITGSVSSKVTTTNSNEFYLPYPFTF